tara:strand:- start:142 stop:771 length:630 start_codon:yes stop_codon:yes gene_type:complete
MFAIVESGSITSMPNGNKGVEINGVKHSRDIFSSKWTENERNAIGIYTVEIDSTNKKDEEWYVNTNITYAFGSGKVTGTYGTATAKAIADTKWTQAQIDDPTLVGQAPDGADTNTVRLEGLKTIKKELIDSQCAGILAPSDWRVIKEQETGSAMDSGWKTWRGNVRTKCNSMQTQITNAANVDALAALFTYTTTDGVTSRPLGEFPVKE